MLVGLVLVELGGEPSTILEGLGISFRYSFLVCGGKGRIFIYLLTSLPAEMADGTGYGSRTVTFL